MNKLAEAVRPRSRKARLIERQCAKLSRPEVKQ